MAAQKSYGTGENRSAKASATLRRTVSLTSDEETSMDPLLCEGMPDLSALVRQTVPAAASGASVRLQIMIRAITGGQVPVDEWLDYMPNGVLAPNIPTPINARFPAVKFRLVFTRAPGVATTIEVALGCNA